MTQDTRIYQRLKELAGRDRHVNELLVATEGVFDECTSLAKSIAAIMTQYTLHDQTHIDEVVRIMDRLLPESTLGELGPLELASLVMAAALHDCGMAPSRKEMELLREQARTGQPGEDGKYLSFREGYPDILSRQATLQSQGQHDRARESEDYLITEYVRQSHGQRCRDFIFSSELQAPLVYDGFDLKPRMAEVCVSHTLDITSLDAIPCWDLVRSPGEYCNWRFVALMLRLADVLDCGASRSPRVLFRHLGIRDPVSVKEWRKHMVVTAWDISPRKVAFSAKCPDPVIQKALYDALDLVDIELREAPSVLSRMHGPEGSNLGKRYALDLPRRVGREHVGPAEDASGPLYEFVDASFSLERDRIVSLVLGVALYADRSLFLRELLQNAVDACRHRAAFHAARRERGPYNPEVTVHLVDSQGKMTVEVEDNGIGMNRDIVCNYLARIGLSYYRSQEFLQHRAQEGMTFSPVSQFGIGILAAFMAGDHLGIETRHLLSPGTPGLRIDIADQGSLFWFRRCGREAPGTCVSVQLKHSMEELFPVELSRGCPASGHERLTEAVRRWAPHVEFPIAVKAGDQTCQFAGKWELHPDESWEAAYCHVDLDLTRHAPEGFNGLARIYMLAEGGVDGEDTYCERQEGRDYDVDRHSVFRHRRGRVEKHTTFVLQSGTEEDGGYCVDVESKGRFSQQGIGVECSPFPSWGGRRESAVTIPFGLPALYDIDLSGEFVLPLSADRKSILPTDEARTTCRRLAQELASVLFKTLGKDLVKRNESFFRETLCGDEADGIGAVLDKFTGRQRRSRRKRPRS